MKEEVIIDKIELLDSGELTIFPKKYTDSFEFIYRASMGVKWDNEFKNFLRQKTFHR